MKHVPVTMIWWTHELRRSWSVGTGSPCSSWWRSGLSWTAHVWDRKGEVLLRWRWRGVIIPAVVVRIHREAIRSWDFTGNRWAGVPSESWTLWNSSGTSSAWGRRMNRADVGYIRAWVTRCWRCWFCKVTLLAEKIVICIPWCQTQIRQNKLRCQKKKKKNNLTNVLHELGENSASLQSF